MLQPLWSPEKQMGVMQMLVQRDRQHSHHAPFALMFWRWLHRLPLRPFLLYK
tara:strand:+ start:7750 stop:7905 length:156 start_codon:yes stop_codon:yes gene_type:complete